MVRSNLPQCLQDILECVRCVRIVYDDGDVLGTSDVFKSARRRSEGAHRHQNLFRISAQSDRGSIYRQNVVGIVEADKCTPCLSSVDFQQHSFEALLHYTASVVCNAAERVSHHMCLGVLCHDKPVAVVDVCDGICVRRQSVKEHLLASQVFCKCLVVVEMVMGQVREYSGLELQSGDSFLLHSYRTHFHETVSASGLHHFCKKGIDGDRIGSRVHCFRTFRSDIVGNRRQQSAAVSHSREHPVEESHGRGLSVGSGDADEGQLPGRVVVEVSCNNRQSMSG